MIIQECKNRATGTVIHVIDNRDHLFDADDLPWFTVCTDHGTVCSHPTRKLAESHAVVPEWCGDCQAKLFG